MNPHLKLMAVVMIASLSLIGAACGGEESVAAVDLQPEESVALSPEELGALGVRLENNPDQIEPILSEYGLTLETYEAAIRKLTENPGEAKRYAEAYRNSGT